MGKSKELFQEQQEEKAEEIAAELNRQLQEEEASEEPYTDDNGFRWYPRDGHKHISVTTVLDCIVHNRLKNWFKNTSKNAINKKTQQTADIGTAIHKAIA
jgi:hypothetical protein